MSKLPFAVVVFDLDGTLADTAPDLTNSLNHMLAQLGRRSLGKAEVLGMIGRGVRVLLESGLRATGTVSPVLVEEALSIFFAHYDAHLADESRPYPGVDAALDQLQTRDAKLAICTNKPERFSRKLLDLFGWTNRFASVIGGDTLPTRKPDAAPLLEAIKRSGGGAAVLIGDSIIDVETARAAAIPSLAVTFGFRDRPAEELGADALLENFAQLLPTLQNFP